MDDRTIHKEFQAYGLSLRRDAMILLKNFINKSDDPEETLQVILQKLPSINQDSLVTKETIEELVASLKKSSSPTHHVFDFMSAFDIPKYKFDSSERSYMPVTKSESILGTFNDKISVYHERYQILKTVLHQTSTFHASSVQFGLANSHSYSITPIASLISLTDQTVILLGYLDSDGSQVTLEDPTGIVPIDISSVKEAIGILAVGCVVVVQADYQDGVVYCTLIGHPPAQSAAEFYKNYWRVHANPYGWDITNEASIELKELLHTTHKGSLISVFSEVWIDIPSVVDNFDKVLSTYDKSPPNILILCGTFTSKPFSFDQFDKFSKLFSKFCDVIKKHHTIIQNTQICIVPSLHDLGSANVYPRPSFPPTLQEQLPGAHFMTNPCRIRFLNKTITVFRDDLLKRMSNSAIIPIEDNDAYKKLVTTILDQCHLCPVDLEHAPIAWPYDHSLRLFPPPDVIMLCDSYVSFTTSYQKCMAINPGPFGSNSSYAHYFPAEDLSTIEYVK